MADYKKKYLTKFKQVAGAGFFHIFIASVLNRLVSFASNIALVQIISKSDFGIYTYALNILSIALLFSGFGLGSGAFQLCSEYQDNIRLRDSIFSFASSTAIKINILLCLLLAGSTFIIQFPIAASANLLLLMSLNPLVIIIFDFQQIYLRSSLRNRDFAYLNSIHTVLLALWSVIGAMLLAARGLILGRYLAYIVTIIIATKYFKLPGIITRKTGAAFDKLALFKISIISMLNNGLSELMYFLDILILGLVLADESVIASYKVATVIPNAAIFLPGAIVTCIYPYFAAHREDKAWTKKHYRDVVLATGLINLFLSAGMIIFANPIVSLIYGDQYLDAVICFRILVAGYFFAGTFKIISGNLLVTQRKLTFNLVLNIACGLVNLIGNALLIPRYGSVGAAVATFLVTFLSSVFSTSYYIYTINKGD